MSEEKRARKLESNIDFCVNNFPRELACLKNPPSWDSSLNRREKCVGRRRAETHTEFSSGGITNKSTSMAAKAAPLGLPKSGAISKGYNFASTWEQVRSSFPVYSSILSLFHFES